MMIYGTTPCRLPLVISAGFTLLHIFVNYVPRIEINVEVHLIVALYRLIPDIL
jgi:hypothetical protein